MIAPSTFYKWLACPISPAQLDEAYLVNEIVDLYRRHGRSKIMCG
jgi:putative transposase